MYIVVEEQSIRDEAGAKANVDFIEERMPEWVARDMWESYRPKAQGFLRKADLRRVSRELSRGRKS